MNRSKGPRTALAALLAILGMALIGAAPAVAAPQGDPNKGDVWVDNVGQPPGPGHEMDPHLACQDINLWGDKLADPSGTFTIDGWPPSGSKGQAWAGTAASPQDATWAYNTGAGGVQIIAVINVQQLIENAVANGDFPRNSQGFHFKLQFSADPHKHKVFWVQCGPDCDNNFDFSNPQSDTDCINPPPLDCDGNTDFSNPETDVACAPQPPLDCDSDFDNSPTDDIDCLVLVPSPSPSATGNQGGVVTSPSPAAANKAAAAAAQAVAPATGRSEMAEGMMVAGSLMLVGALIALLTTARRRRDNIKA